MRIKTLWEDGYQFIYLFYLKSQDYLDFLKPAIAAVCYHLMTIYCEN